MRIVTWNCCGDFKRKAKHICRLKPDILAVQEVEALDDVGSLSGDLQPTFSHRVSLRPIPKSIGMFSYTGIDLDPLCVMRGVRCYSARHGQLAFQVMAVWTSVSTGGKQDYRQLHDALVHHDGWIRQRPTIVLGDFNQSAKYKGDGWSTLRKLTEGLGLVSAYHSAYPKENFGEESRPTHFHQYKKEKGCHIDYCFLPEEWSSRITNVAVGDYEDWNEISDHVPLIVDLDLEASR